MSLWLSFAALTAVILAILLLPLLLRRRGAASRADFDLQVYRDQLRELEVDLGRETISPVQAKAARTEIERRIVALGDESGVRPSGPSGGRARALIIVLSSVTVPVAAGLIYWQIGSPAMPDQPLANRDVPAITATMPDVDEAIEGLAARLAEQPDDVAGWQLLGRSLVFAERYDEAVKAYRKALDLVSDTLEVRTALGEVLVFASEGAVTPAAQAEFAKVLDRQPENPIAGFYMGLADAQAGDAQAALARWSALAEAAPADSPWLQGLLEQMRGLAADNGLDMPEVALAEAPPPGSESAPSGPDAGQVAAAAEMSPEERSAMIGEMVARLEQRLADEPDDIEGWKRLGRAKRVMDDVPAARDAYQRAVDLAPEDVEAIVSLAEALVALRPGAGPLPEDARDLFARALVLAPNQPTALWFAGVAAVESGDPDTARGHWQRLLLQLPEGSEEHGMLAERIASLGS